MAIAYTGKKATGTAAGGTSIVITAPAGGFAAGSLLVFWCTCQDGTFDVTSIADTHSNTYTVLSATRITLGGSAAVLAYGFLTNAVAAGDAITATITNTGGAIQVAEFSGVASGPFDVSQKASIAFDTAFSSGATATTAQADELVFGGNYANNSGVAFAPGSGFTEIDDAAFFTSWDAQTQYKVVSATGAQTSTATASAAVAGLAAVATFKGATAPQTLRPDADTVTTGWATAPLFSKVNEASADGTVITATAS